MLNSTIAVILAWLGQAQGLETHWPLPEVRFASPQHIQRLAGTPHVIAMYRHNLFLNTGTIFLPDTWDASDPHDQALLAHELTHFLQRWNKVPACEASAYRAQRDWIRRHRPGYTTDHWERRIAKTEFC